MLLKGFELDIINQHDIDMEKSGSGKITRAQAKSKHSNLPEGGVWRTIRGSHVYIKDGKVVAGAGVGKTGNAIKLGKAHLAEHQAHIDKEARKKAPAKKATASKATPAKKAPAKATASKATPAKKAPAKAKAEPAKKPALTVSATAKRAPKKSAGEEALRKIASKSEDGMDLFASASEDPKALAHLKELMKQKTGKSVEKLNAIHAELGGGKAESPQVSSKAYDDFKPGRAKASPTKVTVAERSDGRTNMASAPTGASIQVNKVELAKHDELTQKGVIAHEVGHILSNVYTGLASHILDNPQGALGVVDTKNSRFNGVGGTMSPEESWAESYSAYNTDPKWLKDKHPKAHAFVEAVLSKLPKHQEYLDNALKQTNELLGKGNQPKSFEDMDDKELEQAVKHHNDTYFAEKQKRDKEISDLRLQHRMVTDELGKESQAINKMRMSKKRTALREEHEKKSSEALRKHNEEYSAMRKRHEEELAPFFEARRQSAEVHGKRQGMKNLHERVQSIGGYSKAFEQMHDQLDQHHKTLQDGRASEYNKENAQRQIDRTHSQIAQLEEASKIHGKGEKAPAYTPQEPKPKRVAKPKNVYTFHRHTGQAFEEVTGSKVDVHSELTTYMTNEKNDKGMYNVVESQSGFSIGSGTTKKEALEKAKTTVDTHGLDKIRSAIERSVSRHGQSPSHQDELEKSLSEVRDLMTGWRMGVL